MSKYDMYDTAFLGILQNEGEIAKFLDALFSFLYRKTDFYMLMKTPTDKMGFPPGTAQKLVISAFKKYEALAAEMVAQRQKQMKENTKKSEPAAQKCEVPPAARVEEVETSPCDNISPPQSKDSSREMTVCTERETASTVLSSSTSSVHNSPTENSPLSTGENSATKSSPSENARNCELPADGKKAEPSTEPTASAAKGDADENDPELTRLQKQFQSNPESYNGAVRDNYSWSQSISDVDIRVKVPGHIRRGADVKVDIAKKRLRVAYRNTEGQMIDAVNGELTWEVHKDESMWSLVPGEHVHVNLEKVQERWWDAVLTDEPKISVRKIDPSRPMTDLDDEAQAKIEELMYNEHQKRLGLPQSHEQKVHTMLQQAWDAEGSPFKGMPFDPSIVNVSPSNS